MRNIIYIYNFLGNIFKGVVALGEYIYAIGGYDSCSQLNTMERYDPKRNCWEYCASMLHPRSALSASVWGNEIWVFGELVNM